MVPRQVNGHLWQHISWLEYRNCCDSTKKVGEIPKENDAFAIFNSSFFVGHSSKDRFLIKYLSKCTREGAHEKVVKT